MKVLWQDHTFVMKCTLNALCLMIIVHQFIITLSEAIGSLGRRRNGGVDLSSITLMTAMQHYPHNHVCTVAQLSFAYQEVRRYHIHDLPDILWKIDNQRIQYGHTTSVMQKLTCSMLKKLPKIWCSKFLNAEHKQTPPSH